MIQILHCRWCGSAASTVRDADARGKPWQTQCDVCGARGPHKDHMESAAAAWNHIMAMGGQVEATEAKVTA